MLSALSYGVGDFLSGLASRCDSPLRVVAITHPISAALLLLFATLLAQPLPPTGDLVWGAASGLVGLAGVLLFYRALALGPMGAVSVITGALSALVPVIIGVVLGGENLNALSWLGALAVLLGTGLLGWQPAKHTESESVSGLPLAGLAGFGFGCFLAMLGQAQHQEGMLWTLTAARLASSLIIVPLAAVLVGLKPQAPRLILVSAPGDLLGNLFYLLAVQGGSLAVGALLSSLYPAMTTLLALLFLHEWLKPRQWLGVLLAMLGALLLAVH